MSTQSTAVVPVGDTQLITTPPEQGMFMPVMEFAIAVRRSQDLKKFKQELMEEGRDYGTVPGSDKPTLLKPGAEKLCTFFGLSPRYEFIVKTEDWNAAEPFFYYLIRCSLYRGNYFIAEGMGSANSRESKYRYRWVQESSIPPGLDKTTCIARLGRVTEFEFAIDKAETSGKYGKPAEYWEKFKAAIASGKAEQGEKEIKGGRKSKTWTIDSIIYRVPNPDIADQVNTILKIAMKRAQIAGTLVATNASEYFTQDLEDKEPDLPENFTAKEEHKGSQNQGRSDGRPHSSPDHGFNEPPPPPPDDIDTGGHPHGTQSAANHVRDRKVAEFQAAEEEQIRNGSRVRVRTPSGDIGSILASELEKALAGGYVMVDRDGKTVEPPPPANPTPAAPADPPLLVEMFRRIAGGQKETLELFNEMRREAQELGGPDGDRQFMEIMKLHGAERVSDFKTRGAVKNCVRDLYRLNQKLNEPPAEDTETPAPDSTGGAQ